MLMRNERLAALQTEFDDETQTLTVHRDGRQIAKGSSTPSSDGSSSSNSWRAI